MAIAPVCDKESCPTPLDRVEQYLVQSGQSTVRIVRCWQHAAGVREAMAEGELLSGTGWAKGPEILDTLPME